jgi:hypothetical protein
MIGSWFDYPAIRLLLSTALAASLVAMSGSVSAQGTSCLVETADGCTLYIDFYSAKFTAFQPNTYGERRFCNDLPGAGTTLFNLEYLHPSLMAVPVDFRIIRNRTDQGKFAQWEDVQKLGDLEPYTVFYQAPTVKPFGSLNLQVEFPSRGEYLAIVTAGHPTLDNTYRAVFPVSVGTPHHLAPLAGFAVLGIALWLFRRTFRVRGAAAEPSGRPQAKLE